MDILDLKENLNHVISLRDNLIEFKKENRSIYTLKEYIGLFRDKLINIDHGDRDRFFWPMHTTSIKLDELSNMTNDEFNSRFSTTKTKLLSIMNQYIKGIQLGLEQHDIEAKSIHRD